MSEGFDYLKCIAEILEEHRQIGITPECVCGYFGTGYRQGWEWHVARLIAGKR